MRVLDALADAFHLARAGGGPRAVVSSDSLADQFAGPLLPADWVRLQRALPANLPPLGFAGGRWVPPRGWRDVWQVADYLSARLPDWEPTDARSVAAWREAQVFAGVRSVLVEAGGVEPERVVRPARLMADLGLG